MREIEIISVGCYQRIVISKYWDGEHYKYRTIQQKTKRGLFGSIRWIQSDWSAYYDEYGGVCTHKSLNDARTYALKVKNEFING